MKEISKPIKVLFILYLNTLPFIISVFFHEFGIEVDIFFLFWAIVALIVFNCWSYRRPLGFFLTELYLCTCIAIRGQALAVYDYKDLPVQDMSLAIWGFTIVFELVFVIFATTGFTLMKYLNTKNAP